MLPKAPQAPKPSAEHKKLAGFVGSWTFEGEAKPSNGYGAPAGKVAVVERWEWLPGEFFVQMNRKGSGGEVNRLIFGYDRAAQKYSLAFFDLTSGFTRSGIGTRNGNTWTWSVNGRTSDGKSFQERCTISLVPSVSYTINCDTSPDGRNWSPAFEGKATKSRS